MRFYVPNMIEQTPKDNESIAEGEEKDEEDDVTPASIFNDQILKHAGLGDSASDIIASFHDLSL